MWAPFLTWGAGNERRGAGNYTGLVPLRMWTEAETPYPVSSSMATYLDGHLTMTFWLMKTPLGW